MTKETLHVLYDGMFVVSWLLIKYGIISSLLLALLLKLASSSDSFRAKFAVDCISPTLL